MSIPSKAATVSIIIVNYNGGDFLNACLDHLRTQSVQADEVLIVDNASADGSADSADLSGLHNARIIRMQENVGFAKANNVAAEQATGDWLALLNPDTEAQPDWLSNLLLASRRYPTVSVFASAQLDSSDPAIMDGAGDCYSVFGIPWRGGFGRPASDTPPEGECFSPCGASAFIKRQTFLDAGGFDESYFCYCEDVDLGFRLRLKGEKCIFVPSAVVHHHGSAITGRYSDFTVRLGTRNRLRVYLTDMPPLALLLTLPGHVLATLYLFVRTRKQSHGRAMREGLAQALGMLPTIWKRRREVQRTRTISSFSLLKAVSWNPVRLHKRKPHVWKSKLRPLTRLGQPAPLHKAS